EVDDQLELDELLKGQLTELGALQDLIDIAHRASDDRIDIRPVAQQRAGVGPRSPARHEKDPMSGGQVGDLLAIEYHLAGRRDDYRFHPRRGRNLEGRLEVVKITNFEGLNRYAETLPNDEHLLVLEVGMQ